jgi:NAD-dependent deacetylase
VTDLENLLADASRVVSFTGAGVSTESGIPDFRSPSGIWTRYDPMDFTFGRYVASPDVRARAWEMRRELLAHTVSPNAAHRALARLEECGRSPGVITQNIDGLHQRAGTPADRVLELHGTIYVVVCVGCGDRSEMAATLGRVRAGEADPPCGRCGGILKSATVMFGQPLDRAVLSGAVRAAAASDLMIAVGSTLTVEPAASLCAVAAETGAGLVIVNRDPTPYDELAAEVIREPIGTAIPRIAAALLRLDGLSSEHLPGGAAGS